MTKNEGEAQPRPPTDALMTEDDGEAMPHASTDELPADSEIDFMEAHGGGTSLQYFGD